MLPSVLVALGKEGVILKPRGLQKHTIMLRVGHGKFEILSRYPFGDVKKFENMSLYFCWDNTDENTIWESHRCREGQLSCDFHLVVLVLSYGLIQNKASLSSVC